MNKERERAIVEALLTSQGVPLPCLIDANRERPDALIKVGDDIIGVEVTTVIEAAPRQAIAPQMWVREASRIVARARAVFESNQADALIVRLELREDWRPGTIAPHVLASEFAAVVGQAVRQPRLFAMPGEPITLRDPHSALSWMYVSPALYGTGGHWAPSFAGDVANASAADIRITVEKKERELDVYRLAAPFTWLLIDCDLSGQGMALDVPQPFTIVTGFDRVFCCGFGMWEWVELPTTRHATHAAQQ